MATLRVNKAVTLRDNTTVILRANSKAAVTLQDNKVDIHHAINKAATLRANRAATHRASKEDILLAPQAIAAQRPITANLDFHLLEQADRALLTSRADHAHPTHRANPMAHVQPKAIGQTDARLSPSTNLLEAMKKTKGPLEVLAKSRAKPLPKNSASTSLPNAPALKSALSMRETAKACAKIKKTSAGESADPRTKCALCTKKRSFALKL